MADLPGGIFATAGAMAAAIRDRRLSAVELLGAQLAQIARHNPALNAIVTLDEEGARRRAREADAALARGEVWGPLHGVPVTVKDTLETAGLRTTAGFPPLADHVPAADAPVVARLRAAGAVLVGKTNVPTMAAGPQTDNPLFGRTNNPWDPARTPGGSSGGGAAAVAAGLTPLTLGSDLGGSVRLPAHYCGVCALNPTDGRVPTTGHLPPPPGAPRAIRHMATIGPLARSVGDLALALRAIAGPDGRHWEVPPVPLEPVPDRPLAGLRLAWTDDCGGLPVTADTRRALAALAEGLAARGCHVERCGPAGFDFPHANEIFGELNQAQIGAIMPPRAPDSAVPPPDPRRADEPLWRGIERRRAATMRQFTATLASRDVLIAALEGFLAGWDAWLCPVAAGPAFPHCPEDTPLDVDGRPVPYWTATLGHLAPFSLTGHPSVVLPLARSGDGLPLGVQVVGRRWGEVALLAVAERIAEVGGPGQRPPGC